MLAVNHEAAHAKAIEYFTGKFTTMTKVVAVEGHLNRM